MVVFASKTSLDKFWGFQLRILIYKKYLVKVNFNDRKLKRVTITWNYCCHLFYYLFFYYFFIMYSIFLFEFAN